MDNPLSTSTKGKEKVICLGPSAPSPPSSSKDPIQLHYEEMDKLMKEFDRKCKMHCKGVGEYFVSLFDPSLSLRSHGKPTSTKPYHAHFIKASGTPSNPVEEISQQNIDISSHLHGKGFDLMKNMGYMGDGPLGKGTSIIEPIMA